MSHEYGLNCIYVTTGVYFICRVGSDIKSIFTQTAVAKSQKIKKLFLDSIAILLAGFLSVKIFDKLDPSHSFLRLFATIVIGVLPFSITQNLKGELEHKRKRNPEVLRPALFKSAAESAATTFGMNLVVAPVVVGASALCSLFVAKFFGQKPR